MSAWWRWRLAFPLIGLSLLMLTVSLIGMINRWPEASWGYRTMIVATSLSLSWSLVVSVSIGMRPTRDVPWLRIGLVLLGFLLAYGVAALHRSLSTGL